MYYLIATKDYEITLRVPDGASLTSEHRRSVVNSLLVVEDKLDEAVQSVQEPLVDKKR